MPKKEGGNNQSEPKSSLQSLSRHPASAQVAKTGMEFIFKNTRAVTCPKAHFTLFQTQQVFSTLTFNTVLNGFFCVPSPVESLPSRSDTYSSSGIHDKYGQLLKKNFENYSLQGAG